MRTPKLGAARTRRSIRAAFAFLLLAAAAVATHAQDQDARIQALERQVDALRAELAAERASETNAELQRRIDLLAEEIHKLKSGETVATADADGGRHGLGPAASKVYREKQGVSVGGYGEVIYQNFSPSTDAGTPSGKKDEIDMLRAVLYLGYKFDDRFVLNSEIEFEHASTEKDGSVTVEFAYLDYLAGPDLNVRAGLVLVPVGLVNELHEPTSFLGARRPEVERYLLPATWSEIGAGVFGDIGPFSYRSYVSSSLDASGFSAQGIRGGRQGGSKAVAEDFAWSGRLDYTGLPGFVAGVSTFVGKTGQGLTTTAGSSIGAGLTLFDLHLDWRWRGWQLRALVARSSIDDVAELNQSLGLTGDDSIGEDQDGAYVEAGYDVLARASGSRQSLIPFARYEILDTQAAVPDGYARNPANDRGVLTYGIAYRPIDPLVLKVDYQDFRNEAGTATDQFNVALGWIF